MRRCLIKKLFLSTLKPYDNKITINSFMNSHVFIIYELNDKLYLLCTDYHYIIEYNNVKELINEAIKNLIKNYKLQKDKNYNETYDEYIKDKMKNINKSKNNFKNYIFKKK